MVGRRLCQLATTLYASTEYLKRRTTGTIEDCAWLMPDDDLSHLPANNWLRQNFPTASVQFRSNTLLGLLEAAKQDLGIAPLPCFLADREPLLERVFPPPESLSTSIWLLTHPDLRHIARVKVFMDFFTDAIKNETDLIEGRMPVQLYPTD